MQNILVSHYGRMYGLEEIYNLVKPVYFVGGGV